ncbi:MAG: 5-methylcytosine-specific restriction endonuclease system specificity protein McrC [Fibrobacteres bacterium]|nr:5-methylcytosine-specific restriction endonuclease system specificity protein McrC [Fibrobacterota bacterium]
MVATAESHVPFIGRIPVRNLWLLMLYASDFYRQLGYDRKSYEDNPDDIPDLLAEILTHALEKRLRRNLSFGYKPHKATLNRVRGRINLLQTEQHQLLERGLVACEFDKLTVNTPRNRLVCAALEKLRKCVSRSALSQRCRTLAESLKRLGVDSIRPTRAEISAEQFGRNDNSDKFMVAAALLSFDLALPTESDGTKTTPVPDRDVFWIRKIFEKAVAGFYDVVLSSQGWKIDAGKYINWQMSDKTSRIDEIFPKMQTDIILNHLESGRRIVIDTKFTSIFTQSQYREISLKSGYIYQMYAYLRSQENTADIPSISTTGILLHPAIDELVNESATIQGHEIRFVTVDLALSGSSIRQQLLSIIRCDYVV